jgi:hypothetical protein
MTAPRLLRRLPLPNGLSLEIYDHSRPMAGDRWQVTLEVRIPIPLDPPHLPPHLAERREEVVRALGPDFAFSQMDRRHFIDVREVPALLRDMEERLLHTLKAYIHHPEFAPRFVARKFKEYEERQSWQARLRPEEA